MSKISYRRNPELQIIDENWKGNPVVNGRFIDPNKRFSGSFKKFLQWQLSHNTKAAAKRNETWRLNVRKSNDFLHSLDDCIVWLGHASFFIRVKGVSILIDPVLQRISGLVKRYSDLPCSIDELRYIDYVLVSHAHRDHCDESSLKKIFSLNPNAILLTSLGTGQLVSSWVSGLRFQEAGWYQQYATEKSSLRITFLPVQHWSNRFMHDINRTLYGSFMIEADGINIFFNGDSGYCSYPKTISKLFPNIDIAMIGVGAYHPPLMMKDVHTNPYEALQIFHDLKAKTFIPMHYGTFDLADEPLGEPYRILKQLQSETQIGKAIRLLDVGEVFALNP